ncbi:MAG TPA: [protein-PII] uridylyltransferase, partial [Leucothrix sp.]|nr:[protein-PII] uridylyltransferase [Leucothrix sp.]
MQSIREILKQNNKNLQAEFENGADISGILKKRSQIIDKILQEMWLETGLSRSPTTSLIAVGGYGREEMHPASDVDLLILLADEPHAELQEQLSGYVTNLWDLGLEIGHSVRTLDECINEASNDLTIITNLIESRFLCGNKELFQQLQSQTTPDKLWSSAEFYKAKAEEQKKRYKRFGDTAYRVEPNLKDGPGGLRDLQTIVWITIREYGVHSLRKLSESQNN